MKKLWLIPLMMLFCMMFAYAVPVPSFVTTTWNTGMINISLTDGNNVTNIGVFALSNSTRNSTRSFVYNISNSTATNFNFGYANFTFSTDLVLDDSNDYSGTIETYGNSGANGVIVTTSNILADRTVPTAPTSITFTNPVGNGQTITATISLADANRCFIAFGNVNIRTAMTRSGSTCTFTATPDSPSNGDYQAYIIADDRTNSTASTQQYITIRAKSNDGGGFLNGATFNYKNPSGNSQSILGDSSTQNPFVPQKNNSNKLLLVAVLVVAFIYLRKKH